MAREKLSPDNDGAELVCVAEQPAVDGIRFSLKMDTQTLRVRCMCSNYPRGYCGRVLPETLEEFSKIINAQSQPIISELIDTRITLFAMFVILFPLFAHVI